jgi:hypothetical protein
MMLLNIEAFITFFPSHFTNQVVKRTRKWLNLRVRPQGFC